MSLTSISGEEGGAGLYGARSWYGNRASSFPAKQWRWVSTTGVRGPDVGPAAQLAVSNVEPPANAAEDARNSRLVIISSPVPFRAPRAPGPRLRAARRSP